MKIREFKAVTGKCQCCADLSTLRRTHKSQMDREYVTTMHALHRSAYMGERAAYAERRHKAIMQKRVLCRAYQMEWPRIIAFFHILGIKTVGGQIVCRSIFKEYLITIEELSSSTVRFIQLTTVQMWDALFSRYFTENHQRGGEIAGYCFLSN